LTIDRYQIRIYIVTKVRVTYFLERGCKVAYDKTRVGLRIKSLRIDKGLDQKRLSELSTVPISTIQSYEDGTSVMGMENATKLADVLGCSLDRLACRTD